MGPVTLIPPPPHFLILPPLPPHPLTTTLHYRARCYIPHLHSPSPTLLLP